METKVRSLLRAVLAGPLALALTAGTQAAPDGENERSAVDRAGGPLAVAPTLPNRTTPAEPGAVDGPGLAIKASKILTAEWQGRSVVNNGVVLVRDGRIEAVGPEREVRIPDGYTVRDIGDDWLMPGLVELHCHVAGAFGLNDTVFLTNPGLRASSDVIAGNATLRRGLAAGVTTVLYIPGSGTNIGGQGVLVRTGFDSYERAEIRDPGSMKLAQAGNPER
ncbi:MAG: hypothetical protein AAF726_25155, partial [Planctomycetota bacterium]